MDNGNPGAGLFRPKAFVERNRAVVGTEPALRWLLFNAKSNGLEEAGAILRLGRRVLIDEARFFGWLRSRAAAQAVPARRARATRTPGSAEAAPPMAIAARAGDE